MITKFLFNRFCSQNEKGVFFTQIKIYQIFLRRLQIYKCYKLIEKSHLIYGPHILKK